MHKKGVFIVGACVLIGLLGACSDDSGMEKRPEILLSTLPGQFSYTMGHDSVVLMQNMASVTFEEQAFLLGVTDALEQTTPRLSAADMDLVRKIIGRKERDLRNEQIRRLTRENKAQQEAWFAQNRGAEGVETTASGLQYKVMQDGSGRIAKPADIVRVHMEVRFPDGTVLDSTYQRGGPGLIKVKDNLPGYQEALLLMKEGARYRFWIPYQLAYGEMGNYADGGRVGPYQMLVLDMELLEIVDQENSSDGKTVDTQTN
jgi:FKBP-type peptidyl-prolyl cis-trans isomerase FklB